MLGSAGLLSLLASLATAAPHPPRTRHTGLHGVDACKPRLTFDRDGKFKVVAFSDLHYAEGQAQVWGPEQDVNTTIVQGIVLDQEQPNYVMYNGDLLTGEDKPADNITDYLDQVWAPAVERNLPFSSSHGNHDNSFNITHQEEIDYEMEGYGGPDGLSYTRSDVGPKPYGSGNYWIPVYPDEECEVPSVVMWVFDSQGFNTGDATNDIPTGANDWWVDPATVPHYIYSQAKKMEKAWGQIPPALVFVHIPLQKSQILANLTNLIGDTDDDPNPATQGFNRTTDEYTSLDLPFFDALVWLNQDRGNVLAVSSGHDHGDSWCARGDASNGLALCFSGHTGYGGYDTPNSLVRNGRVFDLDLESLSGPCPSINTYISYENYTTGGAVTLGPDFYNYRK